MDIGKGFQNLKHQFGIDWLIRIWPQAFANHQPAIARQRKPRLIQAKQEVFGDMQDINTIHQIELARSDSMNVPWGIDVEGTPFQGQLAIPS